MGRNRTGVYGAEFISNATELICYGKGKMEARAGVEPTYSDLQSGA
jgi:hypothetical protein